MYTQDASRTKENAGRGDGVPRPMAGLKKPRPEEALHAGECQVMANHRRAGNHHDGKSAVVGPDEHRQGGTRSCPGRAWCDRDRRKFKPVRIDEKPG